MAAIFIKPTMDINDLYRYWEEIQNSWKNLYALLLYDKDHEKLRDYVIKSYNVLDDLSGEDVFVFILDDLQDPNPPTKIFSLMRELGISYRDIPCLAFFKSLDDDEIFSFQIQDDKPYHEQFLYIFDIARKCCEENAEKEDKFICLKSKLTRHKIKRTLMPFIKTVLKIAEKKISS
jgi:hypothetical protein